MECNVDMFSVGPNSTLRDVIACIDRGGRATALFVGGDGKLLDVITDGDVRRAILAGMSLDDDVALLRRRRLHSAYPEPVTALAGTHPTELLRLMQERAIRQIPLVDENGRIEKIVFLHDLLPDETWPLEAVVMVGGYGSRMRPLTDQVPKPMLPLSEKPLLEHLLQFKEEEHFVQFEMASLQ